MIMATKTTHLFSHHVFYDIRRIEIMKNHPKLSANRMKDVITKNNRVEMQTYIWQTVAVKSKKDFPLQSAMMSS